MSYDVHLVRTDNWLDAANDPITKPQINELISADPELEWSSEDWVDLRDGHGKKVTRYFMILWKDKPCYWWYQNQITCSKPNEEQVGKMVEMATKLNANVIGDDGESYNSDTWRALYRGEMKK